MMERSRGSTSQASVRQIEFTQWAEPAGSGITVFEEFVDIFFLVLATSWQVLTSCRLQGGKNVKSDIEVVCLHCIAVSLSRLDCRPICRPTLGCSSRAIARINR
jgi:hypothetical protein